MKMKSLAIAVGVSLLLAGCNEDTANTDVASNEKVEKGSELVTQEQKLGYIFGQNIGTQFKAESMNIDLGSFMKGAEDAMNGAEPKIAEEEVKQILQAFQESKMAEQQQVMDEKSSKNRAEGEAFLAENAAKEGVITLESGLQYKVITAGEGEKPSPESSVKVHYKGTLIDGTEFDSSFKRGVPATFGVTQVISGWTEALLLMAEGSKWELYLPANLAYGPGGAGGMIGPEQTLIFEVELLEANVGSNADKDAADKEDAGESE